MKELIVRRLGRVNSSYSSTRRGADGFTTKISIYGDSPVCRESKDAKTDAERSSSLKKSFAEEGLKIIVFRVS